MILRATLILLFSCLLQPMAWARAESVQNGAVVKVPGSRWRRYWMKGESGWATPHRHVALAAASRLLARPRVRYCSISS